MSNWAYCVVGNIVKSHVTEDGNILNGTVAYAGGTKVYLCGKYWDVSDGKITTIGLNRFKKYRVNDVSPELIENVRWQRVYKHAVLEIMEYWEFCDYWWKNKEEDKAAVSAFVSKWNEIYGPKETL